ncbi:MAG TPA: TadE family protein [Verrucomicrobiae bacterium]|nr:TadE family protein [Verrucomicrobiae bacterium]
MILPVFLLLMFALIDLGRYYWIRETVESAIRQAGRYAITGQGSPNRVQSIQLIATNQLAMLKSPTVNVSSCPPDSLPNFVLGSAGNPGDFVKIEIITRLGFFTPGIAKYFGPNGSNTLDMAVVFRNENFLPNNGG